MNRLHVNLGVTDLDASIHFYSGLFGAPPTLRKPDYARWVLEDPRVNFAVSLRSAPGVDHLGIQADSEEALAQLRERVAALEAGVLDETGVTCCYARSDKTWARDPGGLAWETFLTHGDAETYGGPAGQPDPAAPTADPEASPCCAGSGDIRQRCC